MIPKRKLYRRWSRRFRQGMERIDELFSKCLQSGDPETIHDLRVTLRRNRLLAAVGLSVLGRPLATEFREWALRVAVTLGRVRDYDVMLEWINAHSPHAKTAHTLETARKRMWQTSRRKLLAMPRLESKRFRRARAEAARPGKLRRRFFKQCAKIGAGLEEDSERFSQLDTVARHEFRRALRRLRYLRELELPPRKLERDGRLKQMINLQETLGEMQNCSVVRAFVSSKTHPGINPQIAGLAAIEEQKWLKRAERRLGAFFRKNQFKRRNAGAR